MPTPTVPVRGRTPRRARAARRAVWLACSLAAAAFAPDSAAAGLTGFTVGEPPAPAADSGAVRFGRHNVPAWPIYVRWDSEDGRSLRVFGPVTAAHRTPESSAFYALWPVTGTRRWRNGRREDDLLWPLLYSARDPAHETWSVNLATPLLSLRSARGPGWRDLSFLPFYYSQHTPDGRRARMLAPFRRRVQQPLGHRLDETWGFVPLGSEPLWWLHRRWRNEGGQGWNSGWLYGGGTYRGGRFLHLPPYVGYAESLAAGAEHRFDTLLPIALFDRSPGRSVQVVLPFYAGVRNPGLSFRAALPAWWSYRTATLASRGFWPLYASFERTRPDSTTRRGTSIAWPFVTWGGGEDYSVTGVLPLYFSLRDADRRFATAPPLYWSFRARERHALVVAPVYWDFRGPRGSTRVVAPLFGRHRSPTDTVDVVLAWYRHASPNHVVTWLWPFYAREIRGDAGQLAVIPFWYRSWSPRHETRLVPFGWGEWRSRTDGSVTRLTGPVVTTRGPGTRGFGVLPVFYTTRGPASSRTLVGPVFTSSSAAGVRHLVVAPLVWHRSSPLGSATDLLPLTGWRSGADGRRFLYVLGPACTRRVNGPDDRVSALFGWLWRDETHGARRRSMLQPVWYLERRADDDVFFSLFGGLLASYERAGSERQLKVLFVPVRRWSR